MIDAVTTLRAIYQATRRVHTSDDGRALLEVLLIGTRPGR